MRKLASGDSDSLSSLRIPREGSSFRVVKKIDEFRRSAAQCRELASQSKDSSARTILIEMAKQWDELAADRETDVARQERIRGLKTARA
jgi:hypothetical protein